MVKSELEQSNSELTEGKINENVSKNLTDWHQSMNKFWPPDSHTGKKLDIILIFLAIHQYILQTIQI